MKKNKIIFWTTTSFLFLFQGMVPLYTLFFEPSSVTAGAIYLQYPEYFAYVIITFKILGSVLLIIPGLPRQLKEWTYAGFAFDVICASVSFFVVDGFGFGGFFPLIILAITVVSYVAYFKVYDRDSILKHWTTSRGVPI